MPLQVDAHRLGFKFHRLEIRYDGEMIGEYEKSQAADIARKTQEIECALPGLLQIYRSQGLFQVRWDGRNSAKSVRVNGVEVWRIPKECWRKPSWKE